MSRPVVELEQVSVRLSGHTVLDHLDLVVDEGDYLAVVGPNGGGKTTLLRAVLGLLRPSAGTLRVLGGPAAAARGRIGYVPQFARFERDFPLRVRDVVRLGLAGRVLFRRRRDENLRAEQALHRVGMDHLCETPIGQLSGGQMQRALIARALVIDPALLLLDEPTASLDAQGADGFYQLLDKLSRSCTVILVSHDIGRIATHAQRVALVNRHLYCAAASEITSVMIEKVYCCPLDLPTHLAHHAHAAAEDAVGATP
ncbi:MAG: ABC transporter ATP-binding protein [Pseudomonadota bacterium]